MSKKALNKSNKSDYIMVGCDLHDKSVLLAIATNRTDPILATFGTDANARQKMVECLKAHCARLAGASVHVVYEASGSGFLLHDELVEAGFACHVLAPSKIARSAKHVRTKTDRKDALLLLSVLRAHLLAGSELPAVWVPDTETRDDRLVVRMRLTAGEKLSAAKVQVKCLLKQCGVQRPEGMKNIWTRRGRAWLQQVVNTAAFGLRTALGSLLRQVEFFEAEVGGLDEAVETLAQTQRYAEPARELDALTGVGTLTALVFLAELGDLNRFANRKQVASYLGLVPTCSESGESNDRKGHITHQGPARVRKLLCQAAWVRKRLVPAEKRAFKSIERGSPKRKKIAIVALMRRLGIAMWHRGRQAQQRASCFAPVAAQAS